MKAAIEHQRWMTQRLDALRADMQRHNLHAYLVPSTDEHMNEYLPDNKQHRAWVSGFTGSAGDCLIGLSEAWLFADSRYHEQAEAELDLNVFHLSKLGLEGQPSVTAVIQRWAEAQGTAFRLGFDPFTLSEMQGQSFQKSVEGLPIELVPVVGNLIDPLWADAPAQPASTVFSLPEAITGQSWQDKITALQQALQAKKLDYVPITKLDEIAWLFNWRGQDIPYNPVFMAYALVSQTEAFLFINAERVEAAALDNLQAYVKILPYQEYVPFLQTFAPSKRALIDPKHTTRGTVSVIQAAGGHIKEVEHPIEMLKAVKNETEIAGMKAANLKASRGKIRALAWLDVQIQQGKTVTEASFRDQIEAFYAEEEGFFGLSFNTISGAGPNGSIVHYGTPNPNKRLELGELFLIDSGCQFMGGTTDDTRTWLVGSEATDTQQHRYTAVLKAHINCARQQYPKGTEGARLDGIARAALWSEGLDYGHGTGHGVGAFLNVHEGPNGIHKLASKSLVPGMITSIEPGFYEPGWGGIRLENLYLTVLRMQDAQGMAWYGFESLTLIPFDKHLIDWNVLAPAQLQWLRVYYQAILAQIGPSLSAQELDWLRQACAIPV